jgi:hypothetical protein
LFNYQRTINKKNRFCRFFCFYMNKVLQRTQRFLFCLPHNPHRLKHREHRAPVTFNPKKLLNYYDLLSCPKNRNRFPQRVIRKEYCSRKTWSISPAGVVQVYLSKKPQSVSPARKLLLALDFAPFYFVKSPCPLSLRDIFS